MNFSKKIMSVAVATSFFMGLSGAAFAASKMSQPHSDVVTDISKAPVLNVPGMDLEASEPVGVKVAGRRGRRAFGALIALGAAAIIANEINRSHRRRSHHRRHVHTRHCRHNRGFRNQYSAYQGPYSGNTFRRCDKLLRRCDRGIRRACRKFYRQCDF